MLNHFYSQSPSLLGVIVAVAFVSIAGNQEEKLERLANSLAKSLGNSVNSHID